MDYFRWLMQALRYSWILFVILISGVLLVYFDIISFDTSSCTLSSDIQCVDFLYQGGRLDVHIKNTYEGVLLGVDVGVEGCPEPIKGTTISGQSVEVYTFDSCEFADQFTTSLNFSYVDTSGEQQSLYGEIIARTNLFKITT